jgi:hypothetical protein
MSEAIAADPVPCEVTRFEQQLYERSPAGAVATTTIIFVLLFGSFLAIAAIEHVPAFVTGGGHTFGFTNASWPALVLSLLCCTALGMQRYTRLAEIRDVPNYARILSGGMESARRLAGLWPPNARLTPATLIGLAVGVVISVVIRTSEIAENHVIPPATMLWYASATTFLTVLFARGVEMTRAGGRAFAYLTQSELKIDLLRIDALAVLGRAAARFSLIWFVISAVAFLFFAGGDLNWLTIALIVACVAMGLAIFLGIMSRVHHKIIAVKAQELEKIRSRIDSIRHSLHAEQNSAAHMHGLLAYEKRIQDAPEWPFDQPTLVRLAAYVLIPIIPWFGQAAAGYAIEHLAH